MTVVVTVEDEPMETELEIEAILNAMEEASPGSRAEHIGGSFTLNRPRSLHQRAQLQLAIAIGNSLPPGLEVITEPRASRDDTWLVPDIVVVPTHLVDQDLARIDPADIVLLVEVLSPSTETKDRGPKREFCQQHGVDYWIVAPGPGGGQPPWGPIEVYPYGDGVVTPPAR